VIDFSLLGGSSLLSSLLATLLASLLAALLGSGLLDLLGAGLLGDLLGSCGSSDFLSSASYNKNISDQISNSMIIPLLARLAATKRLFSNSLNAFIAECISPYYDTDLTPHLDSKG
jgi:hypothetical protein